MQGRALSGAGNALYDLAGDPGQVTPLGSTAMENCLVQAMAAMMAANQAPDEIYERFGISKPV